MWDERSVSASKLSLRCALPEGVFCSQVKLLVLYSLLVTNCIMAYMLKLNALVLNWGGGGQRLYGLTIQELGVCERSCDHTKEYF